MENRQKYLNELINGAKQEFYNLMVEKESMLIEDFRKLPEVKELNIIIKYLEKKMK